MNAMTKTIAGTPLATEDPVFAAIEAHRRAHDAMEIACKRRGAAEAKVPAELRPDPQVTDDAVTFTRVEDVAAYYDRTRDHFLQGAGSMMLARYRKRHVAALERARREATGLLEAALVKRRAARAAASPDLAAAEEAFEAACDAEQEALWHACESVPTTPAGVHVLARFGAEFLSGHGLDL